MKSQWSQSILIYTCKQEKPTVTCVYNGVSCLGLSRQVHDPQVMPTLEDNWACLFVFNCVNLCLYLDSFQQLKCVYRNLSSDAIQMQCGRACCFFMVFTRHIYIHTSRAPQRQG